MLAEFSSAQRLRLVSHSSIYAQFSTMVLGREVIPVGEATDILYNNMSMNGSNGLAYPIILEPGDKEGLIAEIQECALYIYAPQLH